MMKSLQLTCFRKHVELDVNFLAGLNALRGANEVGKSTVIEGCLYALFGAKSLRDTLAETVTWGHKESELKVKLVINQNGVDYVFTRSKGGAECNYGSDEGTRKVTGQAEVTSFATGLLGCDAKVANALMLAGQNGLRGALDEGPAAVSGLMSKLADFDLIDRLLQSAQDTLALGAEVPVRERLEAVKAQHALAVESVPEGGGIDFLVSMIESTELRIGATTEVLQHRLLPAAEAAGAALAAGQRQNAEHALVESQVQDLSARVQQTLTLLKGAKEVASARPADEVVKAAETALACGRQHSVLLAAHQVVARLPAYPVVFWEGPQDEVEADLNRLLGESRTSAALAAQAVQAAKAVRARKITNGKCPTCGHASVGDDHVAKHNEGVEAEAVLLDAEAAQHQRAGAATAAEAGTLQALQKSAAPFVAAVKTLSGQGLPVSVDLNLYPPKVLWQGEAPRPIDIKKAEAVLAGLLAQVQAATRAEGQIEAHESSIAALQVQLEAKQAEARATPPVDVTPLQAAYDTATSEAGAAQGEVNNLTAEVQSLVAQKLLAEQAIQAALALVAGLAARVQEYAADLEQLIKNNILVAKLKKMKPMITDHLWNSVLAAVSNFFSTLRGEQSVVSKEPNGFRVNGRSIESLSGSTLDVLALAIRVAMTKTFIPHASFIVLDEPAAGCDVARTGSLLGFLASVGFNQVILASHDELSESVADKVIALGA